MCMAFFVLVVLVRADRLVADLYGLDQPSLPPPPPPQPLSRPWSVATPQTSLPSGNDALIRAGMVCVHGPFRACCPGSGGPPGGRPVRSGPAVSAASASTAAAGSTVDCAPQTSHLVAAMGTWSFVECYVQCKVSQWIDNVKRLLDIARTQPHAAHSAFTRGLSCQWSYLSHTISDIADLFTPLDNVINTHFIPVLTGHDSINDIEMRLLALPPCLGGLGLTIPSKAIYFL